jgi:hypothetical protein
MEPEGVAILQELAIILRQRYLAFTIPPSYFKV